MGDMGGTGGLDLDPAATVRRLRAELTAHHTSQPGRAQVEQAKGLLAERFGCGVEEAHEHLLDLAGELALDPVEAARLLLGTTVRTGDGDSPAPTAATVLNPGRYLPARSAADTGAHGAAGPGGGAHGEGGGTFGGGYGAAGVWLRAVLDAIQGPAALLSPVRDGDGHVVDFHVDAVNADATDKPGRRPAEMVGGRLLVSYPGLALSGLFDEYARVLETGVPLHRTPREYATLTRGRAVPTMLSVRACRIGGGLLVSWQFHDEAADLAAQLDQAQRLGNLGWSEWDLATGTAQWSDQLYVIFGRDPATGPLAFEDFAGCVLPADLPQAEHLARTLLARGEPADLELRIRIPAVDGPARPVPTVARDGGRGREEVRYVRVMAEPVLGPEGEPVLLRGVFQDVTSRRRAERQLADSRRELERSRRRVAEERHIAIELQRAILPLPRHPVPLPGLLVAVRYLPAESGARVGGDWYEATGLPGGEVFLAIGDVSGHGLAAAAAMAKLRNALSGLAVTGAPPDRLLGWLNRLLLHRQQPLTASGIAALFDPAAGTLTWAQAGHPPPLLVRRGAAELLEQPEGVLLGALDEPAFGTATVTLDPGDLLLLYTDGLVERRRRHLDDGLALLREAGDGLGERCPDPAAAIEHVLAVLGAPNHDDDTCVVAVRVL